METWPELNLSVDVARELLVVTGERHAALSLREADFFKPSNTAPDPDRTVLGKSGVRSLANRLLFDHREPRDLEKDLGSSLSKLLRLELLNPLRHFSWVGESSDRILMIAGMDSALAKVRDAGVAIVDPVSGKVEHAFLIDVPITDNYYDGGPAHLSLGNRWLIAEHYSWVNEADVFEGSVFSPHRWYTRRLGRVSIFDARSGRKVIEVPIGRPGEQPQFKMFSEDGETAFYIAGPSDGEGTNVRLIALELATGVTRFELTLTNWPAYARVR